MKSRTFRFATIAGLALGICGATDSCREDISAQASSSTLAGPEIELLGQLADLDQPVDSGQLADLTLPTDVGQLVEDATTEGLEERARRVQERYPWIIQQDRGLAIMAFNLPREEFLRGVNAATDLVFDGTEELPQVVTVTGFYPSIQEVLKKLSDLDPMLRQAADWKALKVRFSHAKDETLGLSDTEMIAKYRRVKLTDIKPPNGIGAFFAGNLIIDGTLVPPPIHMEVVPVRDMNEIHLLANQNIIARFRYTDLFLLDQALVQADTPEKFKRAVEAKANRIWGQASEIPFATTNERLNMTAAQLTVVYGISMAKLEGEVINLSTLGGDTFTWSPKQAKKEIPLSEQEALQKAYERQTQILTGLASGNVVFCSSQFGTREIPDGFYFMNDLRALAAQTDIPVRDRATRIQARWPTQANWILEYFYTSLMDETTQAPPNPIINSPFVFPIPTPIVPGGSTETRPPEEILRELLEKQR